MHCSNIAYILYQFDSYAVGDEYKNTKKLCSINFKGAIYDILQKVKFET